MGTMCSEREVSGVCILVCWHLKLLENMILLLHDSVTKPAATISLATQTTVEIM